MTKPAVVALLTEGSYPITMGGVSTWCDQLIRGFPDLHFRVHAVTGTGHEDISWPRHPNSDITLIPMWAKMPAPYFPGSPRGRASALLDELLRDLWVELLRETPDQAECERIMDQLIELSMRVKLSRLLARRGSTAAILHAWSAVRGAGVGGADDSISVGDAIVAASMIDRYLALIDQRLPSADVFHATNNGGAALVGLVNARLHQAPFILTEHGVYLRERYIALQNEGYSWHARTAVMAFVRMICVMGYHHSDQLLPVNEFNVRWQRHLGADPAKIMTIPNGVNAAKCPEIIDEPSTPTISFVGRIDPLKDLATLLRAHALVRQAIPAARLRIFGPVPRENVEYAQALRDLADDLGLADAVSWEGPVDGALPALRAGTIVALSSVSEGLPFTVIEAMMCGRATVNTDVGGVGETVGFDDTCGRLVPARDPEAFAQACVELLSDRGLRLTLGQQARRRARKVFTLDRCLEAYGQVYRAHGAYTKTGEVFDEQPKRVLEAAFVGSR